MRIVTGFITDRNGSVGNIRPEVPPSRLAPSTMTPPADSSLNATEVLFLASPEHTPWIRHAAQTASLGARSVASAGELLSQMNGSSCPVLVVQHSLPDLDPLELFECMQKLPHPVMVIFLMHPSHTMADAIRLVKMGAYHCLETTATSEELAQVLEQAAEETRGRVQVARPDVRNWRSLLAGASRSMQDLVHVIELVADRRCTVLITGETGTGKEMAARAIHMAGNRSHLPMVALNCSAIPEHLMEAELFGHTKGAFTGAVGSRTGRFEEANNSTLFLDEIGDMPIDLQAKLLRVLQERELQRLGSSETVKLNVRVIAASNHDLLERVKQGKFREDLYYRLNVVNIQMPPLRERPGDIRLLVRHFVTKTCHAEDIPMKDLFNETIDHLTWYSWPGNVRQLQNMVERAVVMSGSRQVLQPSDFPLPAQTPRLETNRSSFPFSVPEEGLDFARTVTAFEKGIVDQALQKANGNKTLAADLLRLKRTTLMSKLRVLELA